MINILMYLCFMVAWFASYKVGRWKYKKDLMKATELFINEINTSKEIEGSSMKTLAAEIVSATTNIYPDI